MNAQLDRLLQNIKPLDMWTIASVLGSWNYSINASAINASMRLLPQMPAEGAGIDACSEYNAAMRSINTETLEPLVSLHKLIHAIYIDNVVGDRDLGDFAETARFIRGLAPRTATQYMAAYKAMQRAGAAPRITARQYVESEMVREQRQRAEYAARSDDAVALLESVEDADMAHVVEEQLVDTLETKMIEKLQSRWHQLELTRTNLRAQLEVRNEAEANQLFIETALAELGASIPVFDADAVAADNAAYEAELAQQAA